MLNTHEQQTYDTLIAEMDTRKIDYEYHLNENVLQIRKKHYSMYFNLNDKEWFINNNEKKTTLHGNQTWWSFWSLACELIKSNYLAIDILFE